MFHFNSDYTFIKYSLKSYSGIINNIDKHLYDSAKCIVIKLYCNIVVCIHFLYVCVCV